MLSPTLLKMNYFTSSFKLSEWLHSYHGISYSIIQSTSRLLNLVATKTLCIFIHCSIFTKSAPFSNALIFVDLPCVRISVSRQNRLCLQLNLETYSEHIQKSKTGLFAKIVNTLQPLTFSAYASKPFLFHIAY